jgi:hypothetical protein
MPLIDNLEAASVDIATLGNFVESNFTELYDYFTWRTDEELSLDLIALKGYLTRNRRILSSLPPTDTNLAFLTLLLEVAEQLSFSSAFAYLYGYLTANGYQISKRLEASAEFLIGIDNADDYLRCYDSILILLKEALDEEEDSIDKVLITIINYYTKGIEDFKFNKNVAKEIKKKITESILDDEYIFLNRPLIEDMINADISDIKVSIEFIQNRLDEFLKKHKTKIERETGELLETGTDYATTLNTVGTSFDSIRRISVTKYQHCGNDAVFRSLSRGVEILTEECQLYGYMNSFGPMHYQKLYDAFQHLPISCFEKQLNIIDWGCGQAMASMVLQEYCQDHSIEINHYRTILIEPSSLALKRASLHLRKFNSDCLVSTVHSDLDSLTNSDFDFLHGRTHIHLFSNILDINFFSLTELINLIKHRFKGENYFVVVSPYIDDLRQKRIDSFINAFRGYPNFELFSSNNNKKGEWIKSWTRVERIFYADIY